MLQLFQRWPNLSISCICPSIFTSFLQLVLLTLSDLKPLNGSKLIFNCWRIVAIMRNIQILTLFLKSVAKIASDTHFKKSIGIVSDTFSKVSFQVTAMKENPCMPVYSNNVVGKQYFSNCFSGLYPLQEIFMLFSL